MQKTAQTWGRVTSRDSISRPAPSDTVIYSDYLEGWDGRTLYNQRLAIRSALTARLPSVTRSDAAAIGRILGRLTRHIRYYGYRSSRAHNVKLDVWHRTADGRIVITIQGEGPGVSAEQYDQPELGQILDWVVASTAHPVYISSTADSDRPGYHAIEVCYSLSGTS